MFTTNWYLLEVSDICLLCLKSMIIHVPLYYTVHVYVVLHFVVIVCSLFEWKRICAGFFRLFIYVLPLEIQLSRGEGWGPINHCNLPIFLYLSQDWRWISNVICRGVFCMLAEFRGHSSVCWYRWNWWPSLFKLYFHNQYIIHQLLNTNDHAMLKIYLKCPLSSFFFPNPELVHVIN